MPGSPAFPPPGPPGPPGPAHRGRDGRVTVIDFRKRAARTPAAGRTAPEEASRTSMDSAALDLATWWEALYAERGLTLTDPGTAQAHTAALAGVGILLRAVARQGRLTDDQLTDLQGVLRDAAKAPRALGGPDA